jgi:hypothetical protein
VLHVIEKIIVENIPVKKIIAEDTYKNKAPQTD